MYLTSANLNNLVKVIQEAELENLQNNIDEPLNTITDVHLDNLETEKEDYIAGLLEYCNKFTDF